MYPDDQQLADIKLKTSLLEKDILQSEKVLNKLSDSIQKIFASALSVFIAFVSSKIQSIVCLYSFCISFMLFSKGMISRLWCFTRTISVEVWRVRDVFVFIIF